MVLVHRDILPFEYIQSVSQSHTVWAIPKRLIELIFIRILIQNLVHMLPRVQIYICTDLTCSFLTWSNKTWSNVQLDWIPSNIKYHWHQSLMISDRSNCYNCHETVQSDMDNVIWYALSTLYKPLHLSDHPFLPLFIKEITS